MIDGGYIYIAQPPLYKIKKGKEVFYAYSDEDKAKIVGKEVVPDLSSLGEAGEEIDTSAQAGNEEETPEEEGEEVEETKGKKGEPNKSKISIQRYKGLGEMNSEELWETTMDPEKRVMIQVTVDDAEAADEIFSMLMGEEVEVRKEFILNRDKSSVDLDI